MKSSPEILVEHALGTLPDSIAARKRLLMAVAHVIRGNHPEFKRVAMMLVYLERHEAAQAKLPFAKPEQDGQRDGQHNGKDGGK